MHRTKAGTSIWK